MEWMSWSGGGGIKVAEWTMWSVGGGVEDLEWLERCEVEWVDWRSKGVRGGVEVAA